MEILDLLAGKQFPGKKELSLSYEDLKKLFWKYKGLELEQKRKDSFWGATNDNLNKAYVKLEEQELEIERANQLNQRYLDNIKEGLLLIGRDNAILGQYSTFIRELFATDNIEGQDFVNFLYPDSAGNAEAREELSGFLEIVFGSTHASDAMIRDVNPLHNKTLTVGEAHDKGIVVDASFIRIIEGSEVTNLMVIFQDRTHEVEMQRKLEFESIKHDSELETISAILKNGPHAFSEFLDDANTTMAELKAGIAKLDQPDYRTETFKRVHTLKGEAKYYELHFMAKLANRLEDFLSKGSSDHDDHDNVDVYEVTEQIADCISDIEDLSQKLQSFAEFQHNDDGLSTEGLMTSIEQMISNLASELGKEVNIAVKVACDEVPFIRKIQKPIIHIARNAIDHGIEDPMERLSVGKNPQGMIRVEMNQAEGQYRIIVSDDGAGIDFEGIRQKAVEKGTLADDADVTEKDLLKLIFSPHFSSKDIETEVSGRGLGLDIVKDAVKDLGGKINIATVPHKGTKFTLTIPA